MRSAKEQARATELRRTRLRRAQLAAEFADRTLEPNDPLRAGSAVPLAVSLYREAAYWALLANTEGRSLPSFSEALAAAPLTAAGARLDEQEIAAARSALAGKNFFDSADDRPEVQERDAELSQRYVHALIDGDAAAQDHVSSVLLQRYLRSGITLLLLLVGLYAAKVGLERAIRGPDLALNKPWIASSKAFECHPKTNECGGTTTSIFFHTQEEDSPWVEYDLGSVQKVARVHVVNREDCCGERATPLVIEVSEDHQKWRELAKRTESFRETELKFPETSARWVRLRVAKRTAMHLSGVSIHGR